MLRFLLVLLITLHASAHAVTQGQVVAGSERMYRERITDLRAGYRLDNDAVFLARVQRIVQPLIAQAVRDYPASAGFAWEVHTTTDSDENAFAMAGGKILVGEKFVQELGLNDAELAMVLAHEIMHAALLHNLREFEEALRLDPSWGDKPYDEFEDAIDNNGTLVRTMAPFNSKLEEEADREGLKLAARVGWPPEGLATYFRKLARSSYAANLDRFDHPAPARRWAAARALARELAPPAGPE